MISEKLIFICIPTYNEAENITPLLDKIKSVTSDITNYKWGIIIIDDNSPDGTARLVEEFEQNKKEHLSIHIIKNEKKLGLGRAYIQAFKKAIELGGYAVIEMDADFSHDPNVLKNFAKEIESYDFLIGSRYVKGGGIKNWNFKRKFISYFGNLYSRIILLSSIHDLTGGYNLYKTDIFKLVKLDQIASNGFSFQIEMKYKVKKAGFKFKEIPIIFKEREKGTSKFGKGIMKEAILKPWKLRFMKNN